MAEEIPKGRAGGGGALPTDRLVKEAQGLLAALGERALESVTHLGKNPGTASLGPLKGGLEQVKEKVVDTAKEQVKEKVKDQVKEKVVDKAKSFIPGLGGGGDSGKGGKKLKVTNIVEQIDVGAPLSLTYNLWTEWENFPSYMKKVEDVQNQGEDEGEDEEPGTESEWKAQVFWSHRKWQAEVVEQVPDKRIIWTSRADKGHVDGTITFHELAPELTRILFVLEYWPQGFMERTGNLWRAQGRRVRLELKHFRRHLMREVLLNPTRSWAGAVWCATARSWRGTSGRRGSPRKARKARKARSARSTTRRKSQRSPRTTRTRSPGTPTRRSTRRTRSPYGAASDADGPRPGNG
ncbi:hypothetical protein GCM10017744_017810 [Streptomyces antimycoticus]